MSRQSKSVAVVLILVVFIYALYMYSSYVSAKGLGVGGSCDVGYHFATKCSVTGCVRNCEPTPEFTKLYGDQ